MLRQAVARLEAHQVAPELRDRLADFLEYAPDRELFRLNPRVLAERLRATERTTLRLLLAALYEGLVTLHWEVRCPVCGAVDHRLHGLNELRHDAECPACHSQFAPRLDDEVRVSFSVHQRLRTVPPTADDPQYREQNDLRLGPTPGHALMLLPEFQRLFPQQRLLPDESLDVSRAALLFTDLAGSTAIYARRGDPRAYHLVRRHFEALFQVADDQGGTVVKTIGDAVLAVFQTPHEALQAALTMQAALTELNDTARLQGLERLILKIGLHCGPCLSVTLNERPDYFGTTVNIAARVQGLANGGDVVFTDAIRADPDAQLLLTNRVVESRTVQLKGFDEAVSIYRLVVCDE